MNRMDQSEVTLDLQPIWSLLEDSSPLLQSESNQRQLSHKPTSVVMTQENYKTKSGVPIIFMVENVIILVFSLII